MKQDKFLYEMGQRVSQRRRLLHMTQEQLADSVGVSTQMISKMELGKKAVRPENLYKICETLGVRVDFILSGRGEDSEKRDYEENARNKSFIVNCLDDMSVEEVRIIKELAEYMKTR